MFDESCSRNSSSRETPVLIDWTFNLFNSATFLAQLFFFINFTPFLSLPLSSTGTLSITSSSIIYHHLTWFHSSSWHVVRCLAVEIVTSNSHSSRLPWACKFFFFFFLLLRDLLINNVQHSHHVLRESFLLSFLFTSLISIHTDAWWIHLIHWLTLHQVFSVTDIVWDRAAFTAATDQWSHISLHHLCQCHWYWKVSNDVKFPDQTVLDK